MKVRNIVYILLVIGIGALIAYRIKSNAEVGKSGGPGPSIPTVSGMVLKPQVFKDNISIAGTLEANEQIEIRSEVSGIVESINFKEGSKVSKGQVLLKVNDIELRAQLSKALTAKKLASENERRAKLLLEKQAISQEEYDIASADYQSASAEAELIQAQLSKTTLRAPFSGTIGLRAISEGTYVTPTTVIAKLVNTDELKITFSVPEKYASQVKVGTVLTFTASDSREEYSATIYAIDPEVDITTRTLRMRAIMDNRDNKLYPGAYTSVQLPLETVDNALLVPSEALIPVQNGKRIFILEDGKAKEVDVEIGARTGKVVRVLTNLHPGDTILTYGVMALQNGSPVKVVLEELEPLTQTQ
ncbi:membrane fusion protein, multidrug efflux system [Flagellimonas taeanensis]|jgi:membrane fusion protein (multidrug efflux system)|uniref:Membrane fusion protein, multidrug efflux system n=1 Tax=Flagellimonas taeanensis TaxID=1005926 RepID=A0A1M6Z3I1_9FLAO|nr:efflux RND transporter periplasmic adaptor subunit [Allomuricauda taeanensis]MEE1963688.1 efflux RND transporter periplasmic adaptor subunit [Allomuricauda taeanensis]SFC12083.1 membrane fusion protein, multidrug efflux system [Allomuricauda taeanensis]SHL24952.1 membrane fusion protein, multidrug efflux system [Allomuricauda taeanensis]